MVPHTPEKLLKNNFIFSILVDMKYWAILISLIALVSCASESTTKDKARHIVDLSIEAHGGMEHWQNLKTLKFKKNTVLYNADGSVERSSLERHTLHQRDTLHGEIVSIDPNQKYTTRFADGKGEKVMADTIVDGTNAFLSSHFVVNQPFKMLDPGVDLSYLGLDTLANGKVVDVVKAFYGSKEDDVWWFYFDVEGHVLLATLIYHAPTYAFVDNEKIEMIDGMLWNTERTTYRTDSKRNVEFVRAEFVYSEIECIGK